MKKEFYSLGELAELLMVSKLWVRRRIKSGEIPSYRFGKKRLFKKEEIDQWIESRKEKIVSK